MLLLIYQFAYFWMIEIDRRRYSAEFSRFRALSAIIVVEIFLLGSFLSIYDMIAISLGVVIHRSYLTQAQMLPYGIAVFIGLIYLNGKVLASKERMAHCKELFDGWDKQKRTRWKIYVVSFAALAFLVFVLLANKSVQMLQP
jgi:hypothetical protein